MRNVLLPTDFSDNAWNAICYALQFFNNEECTFFLLHTYTPVSYSVVHLLENPMPYGLEDIAAMNSMSRLENIEKKIQEEHHNTKHHFKKISAFNVFINEIIDTINRFDIDLIIMGTKGATGAKEIFIGTQTMYTLKKVKCPVIAVPSDFEYKKPKEVLFPTDYYLNPSNKYIPLVKDICNKQNSRFHILTAYYGVDLDQNQEETKAFLALFFKDNSHVFHTADGMDVEEAIEDFQQQYKIDLLVMIHNEHSFFENLLFKPVINQIAYHTNIPFLVIPSEKRIQKAV
ncbi:universal stress protein [Aquimarina sp. RZ0]|uniref:universal stress protein n=1 Tax=Aquimarina sp. RZ0 TaxID=2607730 RepID=UPI0011F271CE|nr:universal stress protein [Aquimarina sp. RZ0]KAA1242727.1 universal stress protein [Aquimarina sp. RZ0]